jgi:hypothetical protein
MSFLAAAGSIAAAEALAAAAMAGTTAAQVAAAAVAAQAAAAATAAGTAVAATIPTAAGIGGAMPSTASLLSGAATGVAPGVVPVGGLGALVAPVATTAAPVVAAEGIAQLAPKAGSVAKPPVIPEPPLAQPSLYPVAEPKPIPRSISPQASPMNYGKSISPTDVVKAPTKPMNTFDAAVKAESSPLNMSGDVGGINESMNAAAQRQASADAFGGVGTAYEPAITKTPVEKSFLDKAGEFVMNNKMNIAMGGLGLAQMMPPESGVNPISEDMIRPYTYSEEDTSDQEADPRGREKIRYSSSYAAGTPYKAAQGGLLSLHRGGNFLSGRGDGMSDDIPAMIGTKQPARLADGEFVIPADVVSHIGNGSSKAGAEKLYAMMDKIRQERTGRKRQSPQINASKYLPR